MSESSVRSIEGNLIVPEGAKFAIVGSRFNAFIVERLIEGAIEHSLPAEYVEYLRQVPACASSARDSLFRPFLDAAMRRRPTTE